MQMTRRGRRWVRVAISVSAIVVLAGCQIQLGSAGNTFGNDPPDGSSANMWAAINGPFSLAQDGDPYSAMCAGTPQSFTSCGAGGTNANYDPAGEVYAIGVGSADLGSPMTVSIYDPSFDVGDAAGDSYNASPFAAGFSTWYRLYDTTGNPTTISTDPSLGLDTEGRCTAGTGSAVLPPGTTSVGAWYTLCTFTPTKPGTYALQVRTSGIPGVTDSGGGSNSFSVRAVSSASVQPLVYAWSRMSIMVPAVQNSTSGSGMARLYLADIGSQMAGHTVVVDVFDPGDATAGNQYLQLLAPPAGLPATPPTGGTPLPCEYSPPSVTLGGAPTSLSSPICEVQTKRAASAPSIYNGEWLRMTLVIPTSFTCTLDCWWTLRYRWDSGTNAQPLTINDRITAIVNVSTTGS